MTRSERTIQCGTHGDVAPAFVCSHLAFERHKPLGFHSPPFDPEDPDQQAWCATCEQVLIDNGGDWSDELVEQAGLTVVCEFCFDSIKQFHGTAT